MALHRLATQNILEMAVEAGDCFDGRRSNEQEFSVTTKPLTPAEEDAIGFNHAFTRIIYDDVFPVSFEEEPTDSAKSRANVLKSVLLVDDRKVDLYPAGYQVALEFLLRVDALPDAENVPRRISGKFRLYRNSLGKIPLGKIKLTMAHEHAYDPELKSRLLRIQPSPKKTVQIDRRRFATEGLGYEGEIKIRRTLTPEEGGAAVTTINVETERFADEDISETLNRFIGAVTKLPTPSDAKNAVAEQHDRARLSSAPPFEFNGCDFTPAILGKFQNLVDKHKITSVGLQRRHCAPSHNKTLDVVFEALLAFVFSKRDVVSALLALCDLDTIGWDALIYTSRDDDEIMKSEPTKITVSLCGPRDEVVDRILSTFTHDVRCMETDEPM